MKQVLLVFLLSLAGFSSFAKEGYDIKINFKQDIPDSYIYLAHYYAKTMPTVYRTDSAKVINKRTAVFKNQDSVLGGIYLVLFNDKSKFFEFILQNGDKMEITVDTLEMPSKIQFKNSPENTRYVEYETQLMGLGKKQALYSQQMKTAKNNADSLAIQKSMQSISEDLKSYRKDYVSKYPNTFVSEVLKALMTPETPDGPHYLEDGKTVDSTFAYTYYKNHFWDNFNFKDDRLIFTPIFDGKLTEYFSNLVIPIPDSMNYEADELLKKSPKGSELFKYSLYWLSKNAENNKVMGMDEVFVYLVENYYMKGDAFWLDSTALTKYEDRAKKIAPNVLGNVAPDMTLQDIWTLQDQKLSEFKAKYTLMIFWSPNCGHCKTEVPLIDSVYNAKLKDMGVKVFSIATDEAELSKIQKHVEEMHIKDWKNVVDVNAVYGGYKGDYDVVGTPKLYLLDENKVIIGKGLDHNNILDVLEWHEKKLAKGK